MEHITAWDWPVAAFYDVYLDGEKLNHCFGANTKKGEAICYVTDENGRIKHDESGAAEMVMKRGKNLLILKRESTSPSYYSVGERR